MGVGLVGRTLGSLGIGNIGAELFRLAKPFDMNFIAHDPYADPEGRELLGIRLVGLDELFREADVLSISCPLNDETHHIVNARAARPDEAVRLPDQHLARAGGRPEGADRGAAGGTAGRRRPGRFEQEPNPAGDPLYELDNVILTPHALCWTDQCFAGIGAADVKAVLDVMHGRVPTGIVNREVVDQPAWQDKLKRYRQAYGG